jgi:hypothetical protein
MRSGVASPLRAGARAQRLSHGEGFVVGHTRYFFYAERCSTWEETATQTDTTGEIVSQLGLLPSSELEDAGRRFLNLPHAAQWAHVEFVARTGFVQRRDGRVPRVKKCHVDVSQGRVRIHWDSRVWSMGDGAWDDGEQASFAREVVGDDLVTLWECATVLRDIPAIPA